jgi:hypothetical protein
MRFLCVPAVLIGFSYSLRHFHLPNLSHLTRFAHPLSSGQCKNRQPQTITEPAKDPHPRTPTPTHAHTDAQTPLLTLEDYIPVFEHILAV